MSNDFMDLPLPHHDPITVLHQGMAAARGPVALACSFSVEDVVLIEMIRGARLDVSVFALDTGRLPEETYQIAAAVSERFALSIDWYAPQTAAVESLLRLKGPLSFRDSVVERHACCDLRKVEPLGRALAEKAGWITGQRRVQSITRSDLLPIERDAGHGGMVKINPLWSWDDETLWAYVRAHEIPLHPLYARGYTSIGCAPCTRAVASGEHLRAGRWWWEAEEDKECGLHRR